MKLLSASIGCATYVVIIYLVNKYLSDSIDTLGNEESHFKQHKNLVNFEKFYKKAVERLIPKLSLEEQRELTKWSNEKQIIKRAEKCDEYFNTFTPIISDE